MWSGSWVIVVVGGVFQVTFVEMALCRNTFPLSERINTVALSCVYGHSSVPLLPDLPHHSQILRLWLYREFGKSLRCLTCHLLGELSSD